MAILNMKFVSNKGQNEWKKEFQPNTIILLDNLSPLCSQNPLVGVHEIHTFAKAMQIWEN